MVDAILGFRGYEFGVRVVAWGSGDFTGCVGFRGGGETATQGSFVLITEASFKMDPKYPCPCGASDLNIKTTKKPGVNHNRKFLTCPSGCGFYSFLDELRLCKCRKGFCRNTFRKNVKHWCCSFKN